MGPGLTIRGEVRDPSGILHLSLKLVPVRRTMHEVEIETQLHLSIIVFGRSYRWRKLVTTLFSNARAWTNSIPWEKSSGLRPSRKLTVDVVNPGIGKYAAPGQETLVPCKRRSAFLPYWRSRVQTSNTCEDIGAWGSSLHSCDRLTATSNKRPSQLVAEPKGPFSIPRIRLRV